MINNFKYLLSNCCYTYNHASYIKYAMDGFTKQITTFPYVCCIVDDASTDSTTEVMKHYLDKNFDKNAENAYSEENQDYQMMFVQHKTNFNCWFAVFFLKYNHRCLNKSKWQYISKWMNKSKYLSICEGDDYWICPDKIQKQVIFLENHPDYILVHTDAIVVNQFSRRMIYRKPKRKSGNVTKELLTHGNFVTTASVCYRNVGNRVDSEISKIPFRLMMGDKPKWIILSTMGKFKYFPEEMVAYRVLPESASHFTEANKMLAFRDNGKEMALYFNKVYHVGLDEKDIEKAYRVSKVRQYANYSKKDFFNSWITLIKDYPSQCFNMRLNALLFIRIVLNKKR